MNAKKNATNNNTTTVEVVTKPILDTLYASLCEAENAVVVLEKLLSEAKDKVAAYETRITELEKKMAEEKAKKNEPTATEQTTETARKPKNNKTKSKKNSKKTNKKPTAKAEAVKPDNAEPDAKTEQCRAARAVGRDNKAKYAQWDKLVADGKARRLPSFDKPNHQTAWIYYDESGALLGRRPVH